MTIKNDLVLFFTENVSLASWDAGGMLAREVALYRHFVSLDKRIQFVTYGGADDSQFARQLAGISVRHNRYNVPPSLYKAGLKWLPPSGRIFKSNQVSGAQVALVAARRAKAKFVARCGYLLSDFQEHEHGPESKQALEARELENHVFSSADRVVVTTSAMQAGILARYGISEKKIQIIPNYVETERFTPSQRKSELPLRVGYVGRLSAQKNLEMLLDALVGLPVEVHLAGAGPLRENLQSRAKTLGLSAIFHGRMDNADLPDFLNSCDMFVLPSLYEGHPKALIEAMACGLPVVGTRVPGIEELLQDGKTGLLCQPEVGSLRQMLSRLLQDAGLRESLGAAARDYVLKHFSLERVAAQELALYEALEHA